MKSPKQPQAPVDLDSRLRKDNPDPCMAPRDGYKEPGLVGLSLTARHAGRLSADNMAF